MKILNIFLGNNFGGLEKNAILYGEMLDEYYHIDNLILKNSKLDSKIKKNKLYLNYINYFFIKIFNYDLIFTHGRRSIEYYNKIKTIYNLLNIKTPPNITRIWNYDKLKVINNCDYTIINCQYYRDYLKKNKL